MPKKHLKKLLLETLKIKLLHLIFIRSIITSFTTNTRRHTSLFIYLIATPFIEKPFQMYPFVITDPGTNKLTGFIGDIWTILEEVLKFKSVSLCAELTDFFFFFR